MEEAGLVSHGGKKPVVEQKVSSRRPLEHWGALLEAHRWPQSLGLELG